MPKFREFNPSVPRPITSKNIVIENAESLDEFLNNPTQYEDIYVAKDVVLTMKINMGIIDESIMPAEYKAAFNQKFGGFGGFVTTYTDALVHKEVTQARSELSSSDDDELSHDEDDPLMNALEEVYDDQPQLGLEVERDAQAADDLFASESILFARDRENIEVEIQNERRFHPLVLNDDDVEQDELYAQYFGAEDADPFYNLAMYIQSVDESMKDMPGHGQTYHFKRHLDSILPIVALAVNGARKEYLASQDSEPAEKTQLLQKMESFEAISGMLQSLKALANNKSRYTENHYNNKLEWLFTKLEEQGVNPEAQEALLSALNQVTGRNLVSDDKTDRFYQHKKGSTAFDVSGDKLEIKGHEKRVKIEYQKIPNSTSTVVTGKFSYSRKSVIGVQTGHFKGVKKLFSQHKNQHHEMKDQVADFVTTALFEFQKGTKENPIYLQPSKGNQSELSLAILLEFKKRAIIEGKEFIAADDAGKRIKITPQPSFSPEEKAYFQSFALQIPKVAAGGGKSLVAADHCAGYQLLQDVKISGKRLKDQEYTNETIVEAMTQHLTDSVKAHVKEQTKSIKAAVSSIPDNVGIAPRNSTKASV